MTALGTSLAIPLSPWGLQILVLFAVRKCMKEQYWKKVLSKEEYERRNRKIIKRN